MCGITGFARHPEGRDFPLAWEIFEMMMLQIKHRGTHATGIAVQQNESFVWKKAAPVDKVLSSDPWKSVEKKITDDATVIQGHVRWATHNNAHLDEAAHPFVEGKITGVHNGIIHNWKSIAETLKRDDMINDSQIPFAMLNEFKNPAKALDTMNGYWALTWTKGNSLFLCRTTDAVLSCAYVPSMRALFWNSEAKILRATLIEAGIDKFELWDVKPSTIYRYTPTMFDAKGTNGDKVDAPFRGRHVSQNAKFDSAHSTITTWKDKTPRSPMTTYSTGDAWDGVNAREIPARGPRALTAGQLTLKDLNAKWEDVAADLYREIDALKADLEVANAEIAFIRAVADDAGLLDIATPDVDETDDVALCPACDKTLDNADVADGGACGIVHTKCLFTDGHVNANKATSTVASDA